jgi:hypothetical protein
MEPPTGRGVLAQRGEQRRSAAMISMMKRLIPASVLVCALVVPATAPAAVQVHQLKGTFHAQNVPGTGTVSVKVVVKKGKPVRIKELKFNNLPAFCNVSETFEPAYVPAGKLSGSGGENKNGDGIEFGRNLFWVSYPGKGARQILMNGKLNKFGTRIKKGRLQVHNNNPDACQSAVGTFTATK